MLQLENKTTNIQIRDLTPNGAKYNQLLMVCLNNPVHGVTSLNLGLWGTTLKSIENSESVIELAPEQYELIYSSVMDFVWEGYNPDLEKFIDDFIQLKEAV